MLVTFLEDLKGHCGEVQPYLKIPWNSKLSCTFTWNFTQSSVAFFFFRLEREQRFVLNRVGADLQVFISGSNNRGTADIKDIMATGKRSQVARLVCEPSLVILSLVTYRILEKDLVLEMFSLHWVGSHLPVAGLWLRFQVAGYMKLVGRELACKTAIYPSCSSPLGTFCKEEPLGLSDSNSILMKNIFHKYYLFS